MNPQDYLDAYFTRIGYTGPHDTGLKTLQALHQYHTQAIPFENLNPFLGMPVKLDLESLYQKLIRDSRGGYCFEQNLFFKDVLETLGFRVKSLAARILWNVPEGEITPRGHMLLLIEADGDIYIADVGFGGLTLTAPLLLKADVIQKTPHESYRLLKPQNDDYILQSIIKGEWKSLYRFDLQEQYLSDYEVTNWYLSNHPESHFVTGLIAARPAPGRRYTLRNNEFSIHNLNGETEKKTLDSAAGIRQTLKDSFKIILPEKEGMDKALEKLIAKAKL